MPGESKSETVRCVFVIDPKGVVRAMIYYPMSLGRNMQEILRIMRRPQTADKHQIATPANWKPGDKVIVPAPKTTEGAQERMKAGYEITDWYLAKKKVEG